MTDMMDNIRIDISGISSFISEEEFNAMLPLCEKAFKTLIGRSGKGNGFLGWLDLPSSADKAMLDGIRNTAARLSGKAGIIVVVGIGGSYLGARAVIEALSDSFHGIGAQRRSPLIVYAGHHLGGDYLADLAGLLNKEDFALIVISKSGTTTEPAIAFRILKEIIEKKYGKDEARSRIVAITDRARGALKTLADKEGYEQYVIPDDVGGRYSVLTPVGLLPVAAAGFDIEKLTAGARAMEKQLKVTVDPASNPAAMYACARQACNNKGYNIELLVNYEPCLFFLSEWWKQLYGESEGKEAKGIFPAAVNFTTDLHSMGQYIQEGPRKMFETVILADRPRNTLTVHQDADDLDGMNFLAGKELSEINRAAGIATRLAHTDGGVPNILIHLPVISEYYLGQLMYFFEFACALSSYIQDVNPFDQPGVEAYKNNMFALLGKPGYERQTLEIRKKLGLP